MKKRVSLKTQIISVVCILVAGAILLCWILNSTLLEYYYNMDKRAEMVETYATLSTASYDGTLEAPRFKVTFENICSNGNIKAVVLSEDGELLLSSVHDFDAMRDEMMDIIFNPDQNKTIMETENFEILQRRDARLNADYLILFGTLNNGDIILMRTPLESMHESASIANQFLLIVGLIMIGVSVVISLYIAGKITLPIQELTDISKRMARLDFDAKYVPNGLRDREMTAKERLIYRKQLRQTLIEDSRTGNEVDQLGSHMNELSAHLEHTISELKSANVELQKDIERKEQIDEMRKEFLSNVTHELKTPIALIQGYAEGLQEFKDDEESRDYYCEVIIDEAEKMNIMVKNLLTLNQLEFGNQQISMERFDLRELVQGVANATGILREQNGIRLEFDWPNEVYVWGDEFKMEEVITNYMSNAIHYCSGEKVIRINRQQQGDVLRVSIFNTGKPIPEADLPYIWDKFYKVDKARTREYGGNGIGLSIVKAIMDSHGQQCGVINHADGVEFWFELNTK